VSRSISLTQVRIAEPCPRSFADMTGTDQTRFCQHCDKHVHNLSAMTQDEAQRLVCESAGRLCVAFYPNADGSPQTLEYRPIPKKRRWGWKFTTMIGCVGALAAGAVNHVLLGKPIVTPVVAPVPPVAGGIMVLGDPRIPTTAPATQPALAPSDVSGEACPR
jgi:hypothetical protein